MSNSYVSLAVHLADDAVPDLRYSTLDDGRTLAHIPLDDGHTSPRLVCAGSDALRRLASVLLDAADRIDTDAAELAADAELDQSDDTDTDECGCVLTLEGNRYPVGGSSCSTHPAGS